jgi:hypothetical protein
MESVMIYNHHSFEFVEYNVSEKQEVVRPLGGS